MEQYFEEIGKLAGYEEFEREGWSFKVLQNYVPLNSTLNSSTARPYKC
jgi:hypothetical protein